MRWYNIDLVKGILILFVVLGHVIQGSLESSVTRTLIYSFHMPLFIGLSGYLCQKESLGNLSFRELIKKYIFRLIIPWGIAMVAYSMFLSPSAGLLEILRSIAGNFLNPYYHLWYIPAFMSWVIFSWGMKKVGFTDRGFFRTAFLVSIIGFVLNTFPELYRGTPLYSKTFTNLFYTLRPYDYLFFSLGMLFRQIHLSFPRKTDYFLPLLGLLSVFYLYEHPDRIFHLLHTVVFNVSLLYLVLKLIVHNRLPRFAPLEWLGIHSLAIYLWHVLPILWVKQLTGVWNQWLFYSVLVGFNIVFLLFYVYSSRLRPLRKYVYGM